MVSDTNREMVSDTINREEMMRLLSMQADSGWASPEIEQAWMEEIERLDSS